MRDWHIHTNLSSGTLTVSQILEECARFGISSVSLADHDCVDAISEARRLSGEALEIRAGIEIDVMEGPHEFHLLGIDIDPGDPGLRAYLDGIQRARRERAQSEYSRLSALLGDTAPAFEYIYPRCSVAVMRTHLIEALVEAGVETSYRAARQWAKTHLEECEPIAKPTAEEGLALIHGAGGVAVLAHPGQYQIDYGLDLGGLVHRLHRLGLDGLETSYPYHLRDPEHFTQEDQEQLKERLGSLAENLGLLETRGSDCQHLSDFERLYGSGRDW